MVVREAVVSGQFYPSNAGKLGSMLDRFIKPAADRVPVTGVVSPHAGYVYSGHVAGAVFGQIEVPDDVVLLGPNHTGRGRKFAIMRDGVWEIPTGRVPVNTELADRIIGGFRRIQEDEAAHAGEHSLEVQLPFLVRMNPAVRIVPVTMMQGDLDELQSVGAAVAGAIRSYGKPVLIVVSSDMSHYITHDEARSRDSRAIEKLVALDGRGLLDVCKTLDVTMCGVFPAVAGMEACKQLGATAGRLVRYATSGEVSGDYDYVVGYAGVIFS